MQCRATLLRPLFLKLLKYICCVAVKVEGQKNMPKDQCIIASKHQSAIETIFLMQYVKKPAFIIKTCAKSLRHNFIKRKKKLLH